MEQYWLVVRTLKNWEVSFQSGNIWGLKEFRELTALWNLVQEGDKILLYVSHPVSGIVGCGSIRTKFRQTVPLWPEELRRKSVVWPLRFEFDVEYCLSPTLWTTNSYRETNLQLITRMVFQCAPVTLVEAVRRHFGLRPEVTEHVKDIEGFVTPPDREVTTDHELGKQQLAEIGQIQGFLAEKEYPIDGNRLDVVWRRVQRSVPTYAFEVQVSGDIYHALGKLKRAYDLWNSRIFVAGTLQERAKFEELVVGTFHEIHTRVRFIELATVADLHKRKSEYKTLETQLGLLP